MGINRPSTNPLIMENDLRNMAQGITQAGSDWPSNAPSAEGVTVTADAIQTKLAQVEAVEATLSQLRAELRELVEGPAKD
ncbi:hypothetical protein JXA32_08835 [Candidatus Sumerlaeota bacterium]|nr:hypothetical protein [Candidatus Sumerlaeota bacterium]